METNICVLFVFVAYGSVIAVENDPLACCAPSTYILSDACYDPKTNTSTPMRIVCDDYYRQENFTIESGMIGIEISDLYKENFESEV